MRVSRGLRQGSDSFCVHSLARGSGFGPLSCKSLGDEGASWECLHLILGCPCMAPSPGPWRHSHHCAPAGWARTCPSLSSFTPSCSDALAFPPCPLRMALGSGRKRQEGAEGTEMSVHTTHTSTHTTHTHMHRHNTHIHTTHTYTHNTPHTCTHHTHNTHMHTQHMHTQHTHAHTTYTQHTRTHTIHTPHTTHMYTQHALHTCIQHAHNTHRHTHNTHTCTPRPSHTPALCMHTYPHTLYDPHVHSTHTPLAAGPWAWGHHGAKHRLCVRLLAAAPLSSWCCCFHRQANRLGGVSDLPRASGPTDLVGRTQSPHSRTSLSCILGPETVALVHSGSAFSGIFFPKTLPDVYSP